MRKLLLPVAALLAAAPALAAQTVAIEGGDVYTAAGTPMRGATVLIQNGRITAVGMGVAVPAGARRIDARGKWVTPGLIESSTQLGLREVEGLAETNDAEIRDVAQQR